MDEDLKYKRDSKLNKEEDIRIEYSAVVDYHASIVSSRFTIAGLYVAAVGFLLSAVFNKQSSTITQILVSGLGFWITLCIWILELRSRALFANIARRGIDIEHNYWRLTEGENLYSGFFSRQYRDECTKRKPIESKSEKYDKNNIPWYDLPDRPTLFWAKNPMWVGLSNYIKHSVGLDLLYVGCGMFWLSMFIYLTIQYCSNSMMNCALILF